MATQLGLPGIPLGGGISGALQGLLGSQAVRSIAEWMMLQNLVQALEAPLTAELGQSAFGQFPTLVSPPAELAAGVIRGYLTKDAALNEAKKSGYDKEPFQLLLDIGGQPPPPGVLLELWRRKVIPEKGDGAGAVSVEQGIKEGDTKNKWIEPLKALKTALPSPDMALQALLQGQTERPNALDLYEQWGGDPRYFDLMFETRGSAPSPLEAASMAHRGIIPWSGRGPDVVSFEQAFLEGPWRNKWLEPMHQLGDYLPPPRTVTAMLREGALTDAQGAALFAKSGLSPELVKAYMAAAHHQKTAASKDLAKSDILAAAVDGLMSEADALNLLGKLGWSQQDAQLELDIAQFRRVKSLYDGAIRKVGTLYIARKLSPTAAQTALAQLGATPAHISQLFAVWDVERANLVQRLTPAEWATAVKDGLITEGEGIAQLQALGFSEFEAWVRIALANKGNMATKPPPSDIPASYAQGR
jgi:hypothetical protein